MKTYINWFHAWEKSLWNDRIETNRYLATLSLLFVAAMGACIGGGSLLHGWFGWQTETPFVVAAGMLLHVGVLNIAESVIAARTAKIALLRALLFTVCLLAAFGLGYVGSVVVLTIVAIWVIALFAGGALESIGNSKGGKRFKLEDGTEVTEKSGLFGEKTYHGNDGCEYETTDRTYYHKKE